MTKVQEAFRKWNDNLASLPVDDLVLSPADIFHKILPAGTKKEMKEFQLLWEARYGVVDPIFQPSQTPTVPGWYSVTSGYARRVVAEMWSNFYEGSRERGFMDEIEEVVDEWNRLVSRGESDDRDTVPVLVHFTKENQKMPGQMCIDQLSATSSVDVIFLRQFVDGLWLITDRRINPSVFGIRIPRPGTLPFQRAAMVLDKGLEWGCTETPLLMEWIFAAGIENIQYVLNKFFNHRAGNTSRVSYTEARRLVRQALG